MPAVNNQARQNAETFTPISMIDVRGFSKTDSEATPQFIKNQSMMSENIKDDDNVSVDLDEEESELVNDLDDDVLRSHLGYGSLGVIPLPTRHDEYEHMVVNFRGPGGKGEIKDISLLVFGGINFKGEESRETFHL